MADAATRMSQVHRAAQVLIDLGATEVHLFGSAATGTMREDSDIDIAVKGLPPKLFFKAMGDVWDIIGGPVDLVDLDQDNPFTRYLQEEESQLTRVL
jgi:predicted nucleotidyltransferase